MGILLVADWLADEFSEVPPHAFYRDLWPLGELDSKDAFSKGKYCGVAVQIFEEKAKRFSITDDLSVIDDLVADDAFTVISPISYAGKKQNRDNSRNLYAIVFDVDSLVQRDSGRLIGIETLFKQIEVGKLIPRPTYIVATGDRNIHLYYMLETAIPLFRNVYEQLSAFRQELTKTIWNRDITDLHWAVQQESVSQAYRAVGSVSKDGRSRVRAFLTGDKVSIEYLNQFVSEANQIKRFAYKRDIKPSKSKENKSERRLYHYQVNEKFYKWWLGKADEARVGKRYFYICCLAIVAIKTGIEYKQLKEDAYNLIPLLDRNSPPDNPFIRQDIDKALTFYKPSYRYVRKTTLERMSGLSMPDNRRNHRPREVHLRIARATQDILYPNGEWRNKNGRPTKKDAVFNYLKEHPKATASEIADALHISLPTARKWRAANRDKTD